MGGRGSGGGRSGGGGSSSFPDYENNMVNFNQYYKDKFSQLTDKELNRVYINSKNLLKKEKVNAEFERRKLEELNKKFKNVKMSDSDYETKSAELTKQIAKVSEAKSRAEIREAIHYIAVNEKYNVRGKHTAEDIGKMTNGQLNSFYTKSYKAEAKARTKVENSKNKKTIAKNLANMKIHSENFNKANAEKERRSLGYGSDSKF